MNYDKEYSRYLTGGNRNYDRSLIQALKEDKMSECKERIIEMIDQALTANILRHSCSCQYVGEGTGFCTYCKIQIALKTARACIVSSVDKISAMRGNMVAVQEEIERKLEAWLRED